MKKYPLYPPNEKLKISGLPFTFLVITPPTFKLQLFPIIEGLLPGLNPSEIYLIVIGISKDASLLLFLTFPLVLIMRKNT